MNANKINCQIGKSIVELIKTNNKILLNSLKISLDKMRNMDDKNKDFDSYEIPITAKCETEQ